MKDKQIQCGIHYKAIHLMSAYSRPGFNLPLSEKESRSTVSIPFHEKLTDEQVETVIREVKNAI